MNLFNGYLSFDLLNNDEDVDDETDGSLIIDTAKFEHHKKLCNVILILFHWTFDKLILTMYFLMLVYGE